LPLLDGQVHHDTHAAPMGNYVIEVGDYQIVSPSELGNYKIADTLRCIRTSATVMRHTFGKACRTPSALGRFTEARVMRVRS
jgi:hypothetical protein